MAEQGTMETAHAGAGKPMSTSGPWYAVALVLANCALGAGVLHFPAAYDNSGGLLIGALLQVAVTLLLGATALALAYCSEVHGDNTYHDVLESCSGRKARNASACSVVLTCFGICITLLIVTGDLFDRIFASLYGDHFCQTWFMSRQFTISVTAVTFVLPLCLMQKITFLQRVSTVGVLAILYPAFLTVYSFYTVPQPESLHLKTQPSSWVGFIVTFPVYCFAYQMHELVVPMYATMKNRRFSEFTKAVTAALVVLFLVYVTVGCFGYATYGHAVKPDIMEMFDGSDPVVLVGVAALILKTVVTYPLVTFCGSDTVESLYMTIRNTEGAEDSSYGRKLIITVIWFMTTTVLSILPIDIGAAIKILGCLSMFNIFIFPGLCLVGLVGKKPGFFARARVVSFLGCIFVTAGIVLFGVVFVDIVVFDLAKEETTHLCV
ncbi:sodium-coupled neutral amino acid transporter 7-like [Ornithodoros turicata]|uniref:sodium-coupled neutral amino acid transporter 7-like n=1 Tax=Ornithodoros turicata TaxID=34597 RepID=UPI0031395A31